MNDSNFARYFTFNPAMKIRNMQIVRTHISVQLEIFIAIPFRH